MLQSPRSDLQSHFTHEVTREQKDAINNSWNRSACIDEVYINLVLFVSVVKLKVCWLMVK